MNPASADVTGVAVGVDGTPPGPIPMREVLRDRRARVSVRLCAPGQACTAIIAISYGSACDYGTLNCSTSEMPASVIKARVTSSAGFRPSLHASSAVQYSVNADRTEKGAG